MVPRREDGHADYEEPSGLAGDVGDLYFQLPDAFWLDEVFGKLDLASLVMFLLFLKETNGKKEIQLTHQQFQDWYGISVSSAKKGIDGLKKHGLLGWRDMTQKAPLTKVGFTKWTWYWLTGPYSYEERDRLRRAAADAANGRAKKAAAKRLAKNPDHRGYLEGNGSRCRRQPVHRSARPDGRYGVFRECCLPRHSDETRPAVLPNIGRVVESVTTQSMAEGSASARTAAVVGVPGGEAPSEGALRLGGGGVWRS